MIPVGPMLIELSDQINNVRDTSDEVWKKQLLGKVNQAYRQVAMKNDCSWSTLRESVDITTAVLPSDLASILSVRDDDDIFYHFISGAKRKSKYNYNWYYATSVTSALATGTTISVNEYDTAVTSTAEFPATTAVNEYIQFESNVGLYKIDSWTDTSTMTIEFPYRGIQIGSGVFSIRPTGTKQIALADASGDAIDIGTLTVEYRRMPLPLYHDEDRIELPGDCDAVYVKALQHILAMLSFSRAANAKEADFNRALADMKALEPTMPILSATPLFATRRRSNTPRFTNLWDGNNA